jgi:PAS domain S-box-containing protein
VSSRPSRGAARLAAILDALPDGLVLVNCNGTVVNANTIALELFETPGTALVGRGLLDLLPAFDSRLIPGSMRRPEAADERGRTKPARMVARRTDGSEFPVEVTSANLEDGREAYDSQQSSYTGDELLMLVVRDLSGTVDTEAELARSQRQTEMILRAAAEGVVGTDTDGRVVLVNPAAAQILGFRASDLGGRELHPLILHSREDGKPFPYAESPLADTLRSGRKHRVRGQVVWAKDGSRVPVDLTTAPVRDGDQLVGAVMTFTDRRPLEKVQEEHRQELAETTDRLTAELKETEERFTAELADRADRYTAEIETRDDSHEQLSGRYGQLTAVLGDALRGPLEELRAELGTLASDPAGQLWPEANQVLHHLAAGYTRMTVLIDNVLSYQRLDEGGERLSRSRVPLDAVVTAGVEGAVELIGPGRAQFAVHAPPVEAEVDAGRLAMALAHLIADVAGMDSTGKPRTHLAGAAAYADSTIVVAAARRGDVVRIEVRGPFAGGDPVHAPIVRGVVQAHGGVLQTHEVPGMSGRAYVLEVPIGEDAVPVAAGDGSGGTGPATGDGSGSGEDDGTAEPAPATEPGQEQEQEQDGGEDGGNTGPAPAGAPAVTPSVPAQMAPAGAGPVPGTPAVAAPSAAPVAQVPAQASGPQHSGPGAGGETGPGARSGGPVPVPAQGLGPVPPQGQGAEPAGSGRRRARRSSTDAFLDSPLTEVPPAAGPDGPGTGRRRAALAEAAPETVPAQVSARTGSGVTQDGGTPDGGAQPGGSGAAGGTGRRRGRPSPAEEGVALPAGAPAEGSVVTAAEGAAGTGRAAPGETVPPQGVPAEAAGHARHGGRPELPAAPDRPVPVPASAAVPAGRRARRPLAPAPAEPAEARPAEARPAGRSTFALPPAEADRVAPAPDDSLPGRHDLVRTPPGGDHHTPPHAHPLPGPDAPAPGRRRARPAGPGAADEPGDPHTAAPDGPAAGEPEPSGHGAPAPGAVRVPAPDLSGGAGAGAVPAPTAAGTGTGSVPLPPALPGPLPGAPEPAGGPRSLSVPLPAEVPLPADASHGRAFSVRTLGQGVPVPPPGSEAPEQGEQPARPGQPSQGSGRRRKLATPPGGEQEEQSGAAEQFAGTQPGRGPATPVPPQHTPPAGTPQSGPRLPGLRQAEGRAYAIGAPDEGSEGPEPLDGPGGAVEVANRPLPQPVDDELPPEPLDNPRRLLVWPAPDVSTQQALSERGYRPVVVHSREEVDAQIAAFPAALFVDPLTGPITRTALQSLRQAAVAAEVPVLVTAGLGQATREAAYGADPAVLLKALAPRDSEQHPPRVLLIEEHEEIALALTEALERRGMQVARAGTDADAVALAGQLRPNLVVMDLMQVRRRRAGIIDWLRANGRLNRTPLVVYTSAGLNRAELPRLSSGETVLFLAERSTSTEVQSRIVDLLAKIGTN